MNAKRCDRCGRFYDKSARKADEYFLMRLGARKNIRTSIDLCGECKKDLKRWLDDGNKASNFKPDRPDEKD